MSSYLRYDSFTAIVYLDHARFLVLDYDDDSLGAQEIVLSFYLQGRSSRRQFLKDVSLAGLASALPVGRLLASVGGKVAIPASRSVAPVKNRAPLASNAFYPLPLGAVRPLGWLHAQLEIQANGLSGHLDETWADVGANSGWLGGTGESWERGPYFVDGLVPLAYLLDDARLKSKAQRYIDWTLNHQTADGQLGPPSNEDWWPRMIMLKALTQYHGATGDARVIPAMLRYFEFQLAGLPERNLRDWGKFRWQDNVLSVLWLYNRTGDLKLLDLARLLRTQGYDWPAQYADFQYTKRISSEYLDSTPGGRLKELGLATHGVNNGQAVKTGPVWSQFSGSEDDRRAASRMIEQLDKYHGLPNGMFSCDEHFAGPDPSQGSELCTVVEYMFSLEQSLGILGDPELGDRLERLAFNALPGALTDDMWAHQYNQEPNQVECSLHRKPWTTDGPESNLFGLEPNFGCCTANFHQGWPKFAASLFMISQDDGVVATAYAPCEARTVVRDTPVHVVQTTDYPFRGGVHMTINPASPLSFPLLLRIPAWAADVTIKVNGERQPAPSPSSFARVERTWRPGDSVHIEFPLKPRVSRWFRDSVAVERGALVFCYGIGESWLKLRDRGMTADWQVYPKTQWNYALALDDASSPQGITVIESEVGTHPFSAKNVPLKLQVKGRKLPDWRAVDGVADPVPQSPVTSDQPEETVTLIPYAAAKLRITAFPQLKT